MAVNRQMLGWQGAGRATLSVFEPTFGRDTEAGDAGFVICF